MAHLGRPGPWALFRDLIGPDNWSDFSQPYKYQRLYRLDGGGTWHTFFSDMPQNSEGIDYTIGGNEFTYRWSFPAAGSQPATDISMRFFSADYWTRLAIEINIDAGSALTANATVLLATLGGFDYINGGSAVMIVQPGSTTSDAAKWPWKWEGITDRVQVSLRRVAWSEI